MKITYFFHSSRVWVFDDIFIFEPCKNLLNPGKIALLFLWFTMVMNQIMTQGFSHLVHQISILDSYYNFIPTG